jgi:hypothetical protein
LAAKERKERKEEGENARILGVMIPFYTLCTDLAARETRTVLVLPGQPGLPEGKFAYLEFYCEDRGCDCRRTFIEVVREGALTPVFASINFGWEKEAFYRKKMPWNPNNAKDVVHASLDPLNAQSEYSAGFLKVFQDIIATDKAYVQRLAAHYAVFRKALTTKGH